MEKALQYEYEDIFKSMGTPAACAYATVTFGQYKNSLILQKYQH
jgi:hypothetical protein